MKIATIAAKNAKDELELAYAPEALVVRLGDWKDKKLEIEPGYWRKGRGYRHGLTDRVFEDSVRAWWNVAENARGVRYIVAVHRGITVGVFKIDQEVGWLTDMEGKRACKVTRLYSGSAYDAWFGTHGRNVKDLFDRGHQNPFGYFPK